MKKAYKIIFLADLLFFTLCSSIFAMNTAPIYLEGNKVNFSVSPYIANGNLMVPVRQISEAIDAPVLWDKTRQTATITQNEDQLILQIGKEYATYNNISVPLPIAPQIKDNRTFLPLRYVAEWLHLSVEFKNNSAYLQKTDSSLHADTLLLPKGNSNGNLACGGNMIVWQDRIYFSSKFISGLICQQDSGEEKVIARGDFSHFNSYGNNLYAIHNGDFVLLNEDMTVDKKLVSDVSYGQIQDDWLYYITNDSTERQLFRLSLTNNKVENLGMKKVSQIVITDQNLYAYVINPEGKSILLRAALDGSERHEIIALDDLTTLEYGDGYLYFNLGYGKDARICRIKTDGSDLRQLGDFGAEHLNIIDAWIYFSRMEPFYTSDNGTQDWRGQSIWRMKRDGSEAQQITSDNLSALQYHNTPMTYSGQIFYEDGMIANYQNWQKIK